MAKSDCSKLTSSCFIEVVKLLCSKEETITGIEVKKLSSMLWLLKDSTLVMTVTLLNHETAFSRF